MRKKGKILEHEMRLSESILWQLQKNAYAQFGPSSWSGLGVPFQITSNPSIAKQYAQIALLALKEAEKRGEKRPFYFLELGAGSGKFAYLFLKELLSKMQASGLTTVHFCYVLSDLAEKNVSFYKTHPLLLPFIQEGLLDVALYDPLTDTCPWLQFRKIPLPSPLLIIANYFFDTITQDLFRIENGKLFEGRLTLSVNEQADFAALDPKMISKLSEQYTYHLIEDPFSYYQDTPECRQVIREYFKLFERATFLMPTGGIQTLCRLQSLYTAPFLLLAGDKGISTDAQLAKWQHPKLDLHGTFSFPVNFHALAKHVQLQGGDVLNKIDPPLNFSVHLFSIGEKFDAASETKCLFQLCIDQFCPQMAFEKICRFDKKSAPFSFKSLLKHLKQHDWDPSIFFSFFDQIPPALSEGDEKMRLECKEVIRKVQDLHFPLCQEEALLFYKLGHLSQMLGDQINASSLFNQAISFDMLPKLKGSPKKRDQESLRAFVHLSSSFGTLLQIGLGHPSLLEIIHARPFKRHVLIPLSEEEKKSVACTPAKLELIQETSWQKALTPLPSFDTILFIAPPPVPGMTNVRSASSFALQGQKNLLTLEETFSFLKTKVYQQEDIDEFFASFDKKSLVHPKYLLRFFFDLKTEKNISSIQWENIAHRLLQEKLVDAATLTLFLEEQEQNKAPSKDSLSETDLLFEILQHCLKSHMKAGSIFRAYLYDTRSKFEEERFFNHIITNPALDYKEELLPLFKTEQVQHITITTVPLVNEKFDT